MPLPKSKFKIQEVDLYREECKIKNTLYVPCTINRKSFNTVIDTATQVSVMNFEFFETLNPKPFFKKKIYLKGKKI